jgi:NAD(P)-dependent dehydrogenase (short-subunit alcohol dehydrogenase family)
MAIRADGKTVLVTGGNSGIGYAAASALSHAGARVMLTSRDVTRAETAAQKISAGSGHEVIGFGLDLGSLSNINAFADAFLRRFDRLDVLVNNAGAMFLSRRESADGFEMTWAVNHLGPFLLTARLLPLLNKTKGARIVTTASDAHLRGKIDFDGLGLPRSHSSSDPYGRSKLANVLFTFALARRLEGSTITANCLHPGMVATGFFKFIPLVGPITRVLASPFMRSPEKGAETLVFLAADDEMAGRSGGYYYDRKPGKLNPIARDEALQDRVWDVSVAQTGAVWDFGKN